MNAPEPRAALYEQMPLDRLVPSSSPVQVLRRQGFTDASIQELADSFGNGIGIVEPLIVRRLHTGDYEIIAGERRSLAAKLAGLETAPVLIRDLDDAQALEIQMIENLQRNAYGALEEATGFRELLRLKSTPDHAYTATELGAELGKSRSYVYARLKLLDLCPEAQAALQSGELDASKALLLARFRSQKLQKKALERMQQYPHWSYRNVVDEVKRKFMQPLSEAPFPLDFENLIDPSIVSAKDMRNTQPSYTTCTACPHNSANDAELLADLDGAHICTHMPCFELKVVAFHALRVQAARREGRTILSGDEARKLLPRSYGSEDGYSAEVLNLDAESDLPFPEPEPDHEKEPEAWQAWSDREDNWTPPTYRQIIVGATTAPSGILLDLGRDGTREVIPTREAARLLKIAGYKLDLRQFERQDGEPAAAPVDSEAQAREREKEEQRRRIDLEYRARLYKAIVAKWKPPFKRFELEQIHEIAVDQSSVSEELVSEAFGGKVPDEHKANETDLMRLIFALLFPAHEIESTHSKPGRLLDYAGRLKIDAKKIRATVTAELTPKAEKAPAAKGKKK